MHNVTNDVDIAYAGNQNGRRVTMPDIYGAPIIVRNFNALCNGEQIDGRDVVIDHNSVSYVGNIDGHVTFTLPRHVYDQISNDKRRSIAVDSVKNDMKELADEYLDNVLVNDYMKKNKQEIDIAFNIEELRGNELSKITLTNFADNQEQRKQLVHFANHLSPYKDEHKETFSQIRKEQERRIAQSVQNITNSTLRYV